MRLQSFTNYLLKHRWLSLAMTFFSTLIGIHINLLKVNAPISLLLLSFLVGLTLCTGSIVTAAFFTLVEGYFWGGIFTIAATLPYLTFLLEGKQEFMLVICLSVGIAVVGNFVTWIFAFMLRNHMTWRQIVQIGALMAVLAISVLHLLVPEISDWWLQQLQVLQASVIKASTNAGTLTKPDLTVTSQYVNGMIAAFIFLSAISQLMLARWWQFKAFSQNLSLQRELHDIKLAPLAGTLFFCSLIFWYLGNSVVLDIMPVLYVLFGIAGLSLVHYLFEKFRSTKNWFWLIIMYIALVLLPPVIIMLFALIALFDTWLDVRKRFKKV